MDKQNRYIIPNEINEFTIPDEFVENGPRKFIRKEKYVDEKTLYKQDLRGSSIGEYKLNNEYVDNCTKYKKCLTHIYSNIDKDTILRYTILNISQEKLYEKGFDYYDNLGISIQGADTRRTLKEIINISKIANFKIALKIKLQNGEVIRFEM